MIGKPEWFAFRMGGKDKSIRPDTWQGWLYMAVFLGMIFIIFHAPDYWILNSETRKPIAFCWGIVGIADVIHIWYLKLKSR